MSCPIFESYGLSFSYMVLFSYLLDWQMVKIRDPEQQLEMVGVPEEHIEGHAFHLYHLTSPDDR